MVNRMDDYISKTGALDIVRFECGEWSGLAKTIVKRFDDLPHADVVEVVRCRDCRYRYLDKKYGFRCDLDTGDPFEEGRSAENDDWFCADGVKNGR